MSGHFSTSSQTTFNEDECLNNLDLKCQEFKSKINNDSLNTSGCSIAEEIFNNAITFLSEEEVDPLSLVSVHPIKKPESKMPTEETKT